MKSRSNRRLAAALALLGLACLWASVAGASGGEEESVAAPVSAEQMSNAPRDVTGVGSGSGSGSQKSCGGSSPACDGYCPPGKGCSARVGYCECQTNH